MTPYAPIPTAGSAYAIRAVREYWSRGVAPGIWRYDFRIGKRTFSKISNVRQPEASDLVSRALEAGVNHFNTADAYADGQSEVMLGKALGARRADVVIATKVGMRMSPSILQSGLSRRHILASADGSLKRLGTDYIDVYLAHRPDPHTPLEETLDALDQLIREGKVRYLGFSNWPAWLAAKAIGIQHANGYQQFRASEMYYSLVGRDLEHEFVPFAVDAGVGITVWSPLASGFLSGKYTREDPTGGGGRLTAFDFIPIDREKGYDLIGVLKQMAVEYAATPAQLAIAWLLSRRYVSSVLVGASRASQLDDNLKAAAVSLSESDLTRLDEITAPTAPYPGWFTQKMVDGVVKAALGS